MKLRNSAKCVVIDAGRVLLTRCRDGGRDWFCFPGGGQEPLESLAQAAARECFEETGAAITVGEMLCVLEHHDKRNATHAVEFYFLCTLKSGSIACMGAIPDSMQVGVEWIELAGIAEIDLRPAHLRQVLRDPGAFRYFGLVP